MPTDTTEKGLEDLILADMTGGPAPVAPAEGEVRERPADYGAGWILGEAWDYNREYAVDLAQLSAFLRDTQPQAAEALDLDQESPVRRKFLARLQGEVSKRGVVDVLRRGVKHGPLDLDLFYGTPSPGNWDAASRYGRNRFSVTRQLRYSRDETQLALDLAVFINGLPIATFELKNSLTKQTVADAVEQYMRDRDPRERLFELGRYAVHFAVDEHEGKFCTQLKEEESWFLPFDQGWNDGAGNPPNPNGLKTDYLWRRILTRDSLTDILENYAQIIEAAMRIQLPDEDAEIAPAPTAGGGRKPEPELDYLSNILRVFNEHFGGIQWSDRDRVERLITEDIPAKVAADEAYRNAKRNSDEQNARIEHDKALVRVMTAVLKDDTELFKQFSDNESFRRWLTGAMFEMTYRRAAPPEGAT
jgi:type I site-specific restriction-modification system R (restriction) subunit